MWTLKVVPADPEHPLTFRLLPGHLRTIGRGAGSSFIVDAPLISRVHCRITVSDTGVVEVTDLASTNGTWIDGEPITTARLDVGHTLRVGRVEFVLEREAPRDGVDEDSALAQEGIGTPFDADGGTGTVPGVDDGVVGQGQQDVADGSHQGVVVSTGQVGPADRPGEERVPDDHL